MIPDQKVNENISESADSLSVYHSMLDCHFSRHLTVQLEPARGLIAGPEIGRNQHGVGWNLIKGFPYPVLNFVKKHLGRGCQPTEITNDKKVNLKSSDHHQVKLPRQKHQALVQKAMVAMPAVDSVPL